MPDGTPDDPEFDTFASSLDDMLERVSSSTRVEQSAREKEWVAPARPTSRPQVDPTLIPASAPELATAAPRPSAASAVSARSFDRGKLTWGIVALVAIGALFAWMGPRFDASPSPPLVIEQLPPPAAGLVRPQSSSPRRVAVSSTSATRIDAASLPVIESDPDASTETVMLRELRQGAAENDSGATPSFAITRYDSLPPPSRGWNVLVPLAVEEVYALVPVTSHLREIDDLRGRRINVGAPGSPRAKSAEALYRALFDQALPPAPLRATSKEVALLALLRGEGLDAMLLFDGQPSSWLAALPVETRLQLRLLRFEATRASGQRALQSYLATSVTPTLVTEPAPVATLGEVTFLVASRGQATSPELVHRLCERLPALQVVGHPKWRDIDPTSLLPVSLPRPADIASAVQACATSRSSSTPSSKAQS